MVALSAIRADAQQNKADSVGRDSSQQVAEAYLVQQKEQQRVDSVIAAQLKNELLQATNDSKKRQQLENKLARLSYNDSARKAEQLKKINELKQNAKGYPVVLLKDTLFDIYTRIGSFSANERARAISEKIKKLYEDAFFSADSLSVIQNEITYDITYNNDNIIMSVTELDALWFNKPPQEIAGVYLNDIKKAVTEEKDANRFINWLKRIGYICLIILGIWIIIYGTNRLFNYTSTILADQKSEYFKGIAIRKIKIFSETQHYHFARRTNNVLRIVIIILALYLALPLLFSVFPQTKSFAYTLLNWILTPAKAVFNGIVNFLPDLFTIIVIYIATTYLIKGIKYFAAEIEKGNISIKGFYHDWAWPTFSIIRVLIYAFMFVIIFPYLPGSHSDAFKGVTVFLGVLISLVL